MASQWLGKPCQRCGGNKGAKYQGRKHCGTCQYKVAKERSNNAHGRALEKRYGITRGDYWQLYEYQGGVCYICQRATGKTRRLSVDHDHETGLVRGLLCRPCNNFLGHVRDSQKTLLRAVDYLITPPFQAMLNTNGSAPGASNGNGNRRGHPAGIGGDLGS